MTSRLPDADAHPVGRRIDEAETWDRRRWAWVLKDVTPSAARRSSASGTRALELRQGWTLGDPVRPRGGYELTRTCQMKFMSCRPSRVAAARADGPAPASTTSSAERDVSAAAGSTSYRWRLPPSMARPTGAPQCNEAAEVTRDRGPRHSRGGTTASVACCGFEGPASTCAHVGERGATWCRKCKPVCGALAAQTQGGEDDRLRTGTAGRRLDQRAGAAGAADAARCRAGRTACRS